MDKRTAMYQTMEYYSVLKRDGFSGGASGKEPSTQELQEMWVRSLGQEDPLEKGTATYSSILAWRIP